MKHNDPEDSFQQRKTRIKKILEEDYGIDNKRKNPRSLVRAVTIGIILTTAIASFSPLGIAYTVLGKTQSTPSLQVLVAGFYFPFILASIAAFTLKNERTYYTLIVGLASTVILNLTGCRGILDELSKIH